MTSTGNGVSTPDDGDLVVSLLSIASGLGVLLSLIIEVASWIFEFNYPFLWVAGISVGILYLATLYSDRGKRAQKREDKLRIERKWAEEQAIRKQRAATADAEAWDKPMRPPERYDIEDQRRRDTAVLSRGEELRRRYMGPSIVDWKTAEYSAMKHMEASGHWDAKLTPPGPDGGVDIVSARGIAQVKHYSSPVGPEPIERLAGVARMPQHRDKAMLFFATNGYTSNAITQARYLHVALYLYDWSSRRWQRID